MAILCSAASSTQFFAILPLDPRQLNYKSI